MKYLILVFATWMSLNLNAQVKEDIAYNCKTADKKDLSITTTHAGKALKYNGVDILITKYDLSYAGSVISTFYLYKYKGNLHVIDGSTMKLNSTTDPILLNGSNSYFKNIKLNGIFANIDFVHSRDYSINDLSFIEYNTTSHDKTSPLQLVGLTFDKKQLISEFRFKSKAGNCSCTKNKIIVKLGKG